MLGDGQGSLVSEQVVWCVCVANIEVLVGGVVGILPPFMFTIHFPITSVYIRSRIKVYCLFAKSLFV